MTYVQPLTIDEVRDPELKSLIARCESVGVPGSLFARILARAPAHARAVLDAMLLSHTGGNIPHKLKEIVRVQLARRAGDPYFSRLRSAPAVREGLDEAVVTAGCEDYERSLLFTEKEKWALRYADQMYLNPTSVDAAFYDGMKQHYSEAEIMELGAFIALWYGMQVFMRTLGELYRGR